MTTRGWNIAVYALCGFANLGSLGIQIGVLSALGPNRKATIVKVAVSSLACGFLATCQTAGKCPDPWDLPSELQRWKLTRLCNSHRYRWPASIKRLCLPDRLRNMLFHTGIHSSSLQHLNICTYGTCHLNQPITMFICRRASVLSC